MSEFVISKLTYNFWSLFVSQALTSDFLTYISPKLCQSSSLKKQSRVLGCLSTTYKPKTSSCLYHSSPFLLSLRSNILSQDSEIRRHQKFSYIIKQFSETQTSNTFRENFVSYNSQTCFKQRLVPNDIYQYYNRIQILSHRIFSLYTL